MQTQQLSFLLLHIKQSSVKETNFQIEQGMENRFFKVFLLKPASLSICLISLLNAISYTLISYPHFLPQYNISP